MVKVSVEMGVYTGQEGVGTGMRKRSETLWGVKGDNRHKPNPPG